MEKTSGWWRNLLLPAALTAAATVLIDWLVITLLLRRAVEGIALQAASGVLTVALGWTFYKAFSQRLPKAAESRVLTWTLTADSLILGETSISRDSIRMVHCWKKGESWTVNIETSGKNHLLRTLSGGEGAKRSAQQMRALVTALGYQAQWKEA